MYNIFELGASGVKVDFVILYLYLLCLSFWTGKKIQKVEKSNLSLKLYWRSCVPLVLSYSLIEGLRYLRGIDYLVYVYVYKGYEVRNELLFTYLNGILRLMHVEFYGAFVVYDFLFIVALLFLVRRLPNYACYLLPLLVVSQFYYSENFIRQYVAFSFSLVSIVYCLDRKWSAFIFLSAIATMFHTVAFVLQIIIFFCVYPKKAFSPYVSCCLYVLFAFVSKLSFLDFISNFISEYLVGMFAGTAFSVYTENSLSWFGQNAVDEIYSQSILSCVAMGIFDISLVAFSYCAIQRESDSQRKQTMIAMYNLIVYGIVGLQLFMNVQLLRRLVVPFYAMWPILFVYLLYKKIHVLQCMKNRVSRLSFRMIVVYMMLYVFAYHVTKGLFLFEGQMFIWDMGSTIGSYNPLFKF